MKKNIILLHSSLDNQRWVARASRDAVAAALVEDTYAIDSIEITPRGWERDGQTVDIDQALLLADYAWIAGHGHYTEDGQVQQILESHRVPYNGSDAMVSRVCFDKHAAKELLQRKGYQTPVWTHYSLDQDPHALSDEIFQNNPQPCIIKPRTGGSSLGTALARSKQQVTQALEQAREHTKEIIVEEYIDGRELTVGVVEGLREQRYCVLPAVEIFSRNSIFDYQAKHQGASENVCPADLAETPRNELAELSQRIFKDFQLRNYARIDYIVHPTRGMYVLEINTLPDLSPRSLISQELAAIGSSVKELVGCCME